MPKDVRKNPRPGDSITYFEDGKRKAVEIVAIDERGVLTYREDGVERITTLTVWRLIAARGSGSVSTA